MCVPVCDALPSPLWVAACSSWTSSRSLLIARRFHTGAPGPTDNIFFGCNLLKPSTSFGTVTQSLPGFLSPPVDRRFSDNRWRRVEISPPLPPRRRCKCVMSRGITGNVFSVLDPFRSLGFVQLHIYINASQMQFIRSTGGQQYRLS